MNQKFDNAVLSWIEKPHCIHKDIFAAKISVKGNLLSDEPSCWQRSLIPKLRKTTHQFGQLDEVINCDPTSRSFTFTSTSLEYVISLDSNNIIQIKVERICTNEEPCLLTPDWLTHNLAPCLNQWLARPTNHPSHQPQPPSLACVDPVFYQKTYLSLKAKYSTLVKQTLWQFESSVYFVDLGCGNGLLTFLLISEGFPGIGLDVRRRKIWSSYPPNVQECLVERQFNPQESSGFPDANWLIGNHSDELTPWLPILASKSGVGCKVFALPCCPFALFGKYNNSTPHYNHRSSPGQHGQNRKSSSRYRDYLTYLETVFYACGFQPERDILRIPSTKRVCFIGRNFDSSSTSSSSCRLQAGQNVVDRELDQLKSQSGYDRQSTPDDSQFKPRPQVEPVVNCSRLPRDVSLPLCQSIAQRLLDLTLPPNEADQLRLQGLQVSDDNCRVLTSDGRWWQPGGKIQINTLAGQLPTDIRTLMKAQNGGLQTLLRNFHQTFLTHKGTVQLRWDPTKLIPDDNKSSTQPSNKPLRTKPCWMHENHPDGCPYTSETCNFAHSTL